MTPDAHAIALIEAAATRAFAPGVGFFQHGTDLQHSLESNEQTPQVFLFDPTPSQDTAAAPVVKLGCYLLFLDAEPGDGDDPDAGEATILRMAQLKDRFVGFLDQHPLLEIEGLTWEAERQIYAGRLTGVLLKFQLKVPRPLEAAACAVV